MPNANKQLRFKSHKRIGAAAAILTLVLLAVIIILTIGRQQRWRTLELFGPPSQLSADHKYFTLLTDDAGCGTVGYPVTKVGESSKSIVVSAKIRIKDEACAGSGDCKVAVAVRLASPLDGRQVFDGGHGTPAHLKTGQIVCAG